MPIEFKREKNDEGDSVCLVIAYDYRAFGERVTLAEAADKVTETFTGKELDDETGLNYFGARYLDPMLGLWISVDLAGQFASPYVYVGNGVNPVNGVDADGNVLLFAPGSSPEFKAEFARAIQYLNNGKSSSVFAALQKRKEIVYIKEAGIDETGMSRRDPDLNAPIIYWNPYGALVFEGGKQSPALGALHEAEHALGYLENPAQFHNKSMVPDQQYDDNEERRVISGPEAIAARKLGEDVRDSHDGTEVQVKHSDELPE